jgi:hypothetical protein
MMVVDVVTAPTLSAGKPRRLFEKRYQRSQAFWPNYDVTADGKRFLMIKRAEQTAPTPHQRRAQLGRGTEAARAVS